MDVRVVCVVACLCALAVTSAEAGIPKCCVKTTPHVSRDQLRRVYRMERQYSSGACDIDALLLYVRGERKPICAKSIRLETLFHRMSKLKA